MMAWTLFQQTTWSTFLTQVLTRQLRLLHLPKPSMPRLSQSRLVPTRCQRPFSAHRLRHSRMLSTHKTTETQVCRSRVQMLGWRKIKASTLIIRPNLHLTSSATTNMGLSTPRAKEA